MAVRDPSAGGLVHAAALLLLGPIALGQPQSAPVPFQVDASKRFPISSFIYGHNHPNWRTIPWAPTLARSGGNRMTAYNWENNASNAGSDWRHQNDAFLGGGETPGEVVRAAVASAHDHGAACVVTVPIIGRVAADKNGGGDVNRTPDYLKTRFVPSLSRKDKPFAFPPDPKDGAVYQDEFVAWVEKTFPQARDDPRRTIFYSLDNEPELWSATHARVHPEKVRFDEVARLNAEYAEAVKRAAPNATVFGFVSYGWHGLTTLQDAPDRNGRDFADFYLQEMSRAEKKAGRRLVDVLDLHWYPEIRAAGKRVTEDDSAPAVAAARVQAPRSLWDPTYRETSWIGDSLRGPVRLLPRLREKIERHYPGTRLAVTEYCFGGGDHISGAIAQADALGIFGREGLFAAALWHLGKTDDRMIHAACAMYRDYDGKGGAFGETGLAATGGDPARASLYAALDAQNRVTLVAINKTEGPLAVRIELKDAPDFRSASVHRLSAGEAKPVAQGEIKPEGKGALAFELPALSVSTLVLHP